ncbi:unnamed protein product, partial [Trichogramma brassicae]
MPSRSTTDLFNFSHLVADERALDKYHYVAIAHLVRYTRRCCYIDEGACGEHDFLFISPNGRHPVLFFAQFLFLSQLKRRPRVIIDEKLLGNDKELIVISRGYYSYSTRYSEEARELFLLRTMGARVVTILLESSIIIKVLQKILKNQVQLNDIIWPEQYLNVQNDNYESFANSTDSGFESKLESLLPEPVSTDFSRNSQQVTERLANPSRIPAEQPPSSAPQIVAQKVAQKVAPEVRKKRGPGRPRKNQVASKETKKTVKKSPVTSRKRQPSNNFQGEAQFENSKLRELTIYKDLGSAGTTPTPSSESSNSPPPNDIEDFVSAPTSSRVYAEKHIPVMYSSQRKRRLTPDVSDNLPQSKRRRRQVETTQPPGDHLYSANSITAQQPNIESNARTTEKKLKVHLPTKKAPKEPAFTGQKKILNPGPLIKDNEKVILRPGYSRVEQKGEKKGRKRVFNKPPIEVEYNKAANNLRREQIVMTTKKLLSTNKIIQRRMARFSFLPGVTVEDVNNAWDNWLDKTKQIGRFNEVSNSGQNSYMKSSRFSSFVYKNHTFLQISRATWSYIASFSDTGCYGDRKVQTGHPARKKVQRRDNIRRQHADVLATVHGVYAARPQRIFLLTFVVGFETLRHKSFNSTNMAIRHNDRASQDKGTRDDVRIIYICIEYLRITVSARRSSVRFAPTFLSLVSHMYQRCGEEAKLLRLRLFSFQERTCDALQSLARHTINITYCNTHIHTGPPRAILYDYNQTINKTHKSVTTTADGDECLVYTLSFKRTPINEYMGDPRAVYKGLDITSAKVTKEEQSQAKHHMLDVVDPINEYTVVVARVQRRRLRYSSPWRIAAAARVTMILRAHAGFAAAAACYNFVVLVVFTVIHATLLPYTPREVEKGSERWYRKNLCGLGLEVPNCGGAAAQVVLRDAAAIAESLLCNVSTQQKNVARLRVALYIYSTQELWPRVYNDVFFSELYSLRRAVRFGHRIFAKNPFFSCRRRRRRHHRGRVEEAVMHKCAIGTHIQSISIVCIRAYVLIVKYLQCTRVHREKFFGFLKKYYTKIKNDKRCLKIQGYYLNDSKKLTAAATRQQQRCYRSKKRYVLLYSPGDVRRRGPLCVCVYEHLFVTSLSRPKVVTTLLMMMMMMMTMMVGRRVSTLRRARQKSHDSAAAHNARGFDRWEIYTFARTAAAARDELGKCSTIAYTARTKESEGGRKESFHESLEIFEQHGITHSEILRQQRVAGGSGLGGPLRQENSIILWLTCNKSKTVEVTAPGSCRTRYVYDDRCESISLSLKNKYALLATVPSDRAARAIVPWSARETCLHEPYKDRRNISSLQI